jgi:hypothetical protein
VFNGQPYRDKKVVGMRFRAPLHTHKPERDSLSVNNFPTVKDFQILLVVELQKNSLQRNHL